MENAIEIALDYGIDPSSPRTARRLQHHNNVPADINILEKGNVFAISRSTR